MSDYRDTAWEQDCLRCNPFEGDRDTNERIMRDRIVTARKDGDCSGYTADGECERGVRKGDRTRVQVAIVDGELCQCRWCEECSIDMAKSLYGEARWQLAYL